LLAFIVSIINYYQLYIQLASIVDLSASNTPSKGTFFTLRSIPRVSASQTMKMGNKTAIAIYEVKGVNEHDEGLNEPTAMMEKDDELEANEDLPDWLPDGWIMEIYHAKDGSLNQVSLIPHMHAWPRVEYYIEGLFGCTKMTEWGLKMVCGQRWFTQHYCSIIIYYLVLLIFLNYLKLIFYSIVLFLFIFQLFITFISSCNTVLHFTHFESHIHWTVTSAGISFLWNG
jgi:hypothetical protein